jgi:hypothetical protein
MIKDVTKWCLRWLVPYGYLRRNEINLQSIVQLMWSWKRSTRSPRIVRRDIGMATGNSPSGIDRPSPSLRGQIFPAPAPAKTDGGQFDTAPVPAGDYIPDGVLVPANNVQATGSITQFMRQIYIHYSNHKVNSTFQHCICNCTAVHTTQSAQQHNHKINKF